jgi:RimJ/RimL family protein N-acetyltransferase
VNELETQRLALSKFGENDAAFVLRLLNDPGYLRYIGDKGVRDTDDARNYIRTGPVVSYQQHGFGLYKVCLKDSGEPIGMCGLLKREALEDVDIGFAFLPEFQSLGYAEEAAAAVMEQGRAGSDASASSAYTLPTTPGLPGCCNNWGCVSKVW